MYGIVAWRVESTVLLYCYYGFCKKICCIYRSSPETSAVETESYSAHQNQDALQVVSTQLMESAISRSANIGTSSQSLTLPITVSQHDSSTSIIPSSNFLPTTTSSQINSSVTLSATSGHNPMQQLTVDSDDDMESCYDAAELLRHHCTQTLLGPPLCLEVSRENLFSQAVAFYKKASNIQLSRPLQIRFDGEDGVDAGGLKREFFQELFKLVFAPEKGLFEGRPRKLWPVHNITAFRTRLFKIVGTALAHCIAQCEIGMPFLAEPLVTYFLSDNEDDCISQITIEDMPESDIKCIALEV